MEENNEREDGVYMEKPKSGTWFILFQAQIKWIDK